MRRPRVVILTSGDELAPYGQPLRDGEIYDGNTPMLCGGAGPLRRDTARPSAGARYLPNPYAARSRRRWRLRLT
ncbi:MAG: hypothetical protein HND48_11835 [Chloroflexi bacterium]|nr:hypothetical protein [Chloroflexota bacterium]